MPQHFLLTPAARTLSLASVMRMSDEEAERTFVRLRWADNDGDAYCPHCGCTINHLFLPSPERCAALALQSMPKGFLGYERHIVRVSQDAAQILLARHRDLL